MDIFSKHHPLVIMMYYAIAFVLILFIGHPVVYGIAAGAMFMTRFFQVGVKQSIYSFLYSCSACGLCLIINPLCNHRGATLLFMLGEMRITKEAALYGGHMALLLLASVFLFSCFSHYMTAQNIMTLTGRRFPSFSMLFTMILRIVPKVQSEFRTMRELHGNQPKVIASLLSIHLEESVQRSIAMKQKGYGAYKRSQYYYRSMKMGDWLLLCFMIVMTAFLFWSCCKRDLCIRYFPSIRIDSITVWEYVIILAYMCIPMILRGKEECKWFWWKRKITNSIIRNKQSRQLS